MASPVVSRTARPATMSKAVTPIAAARWNGATYDVMGAAITKSIGGDVIRRCTASHGAPATDR
jgi:hypothetical protein